MLAKIFILMADTLFDTHVLCKHVHTQTTAGGGRSSPKPYLSKSTDIFPENDPGKSKSHPKEYFLSESLKLSDIYCKYQ